MKDGEIARTTKELEDLLMANEKKQKSPMEELLAEMESAVARVEKRGNRGPGRKDENGGVRNSERERHVAWKTAASGDSYLDEDIPDEYFDEDLERVLSGNYPDEADGCFWMDFQKKAEVIFWRNLRKPTEADCRNRNQKVSAAKKLWSGRFRQRSREQAAVSVEIFLMKQLPVEIFRRRGRS